MKLWFTERSCVVPEVSTFKNYHTVWQTLDKYSRLEGKNIPLQTDLNLRAKNKRLPQDQTLNFAHTLALESQGITNSKKTTCGPCDLETLRKQSALSSTRGVNGSHQQEQTTAKCPAPL